MLSGIENLKLRSEIRLPFGGFAHAEAVAELLEGFGVVGVGGVDMFAFGDELHGVVAADAGLAENFFERFQTAGIDDQKLMFVELDFHGLGGGNDRHAGATVVQEQFLKVAEIAFEDRAIDVFAEQVAMLAAGLLVARFQNDVDHQTERLEQGEKYVEERLAGDGGRQDWNLQTSFRIAIRFQAEAFARNDLQVQSGPNRLGQLEVAVAIHLQMGQQLLRAHVCTCSRKTLLELFPVRRCSAKGAKDFLFEI